MIGTAKSGSAAVALVLAGAVGLMLVGGTSAHVVPGGGSPATDCYIGLEVDDVEVPPGVKRIECNDCDPACDHDGDNTPNGTCTFQVRGCTNIEGVPGCTPVALRKAKITPASLRIESPISGTAASACGAFTNVEVETKARGMKPGKRQLNLFAKAQKKDQDKLVLVCNPQPGTCPPPPTTSTSTATTATTTSSTSSTGPSTTSTSSSTTTSTSEPTTTSTSSSSTTSTSEETTTSTSSSSTTSTSEPTTTSTSSSTTTTTTTTLPMSPSGAFLG